MKKTFVSAGLLGLSLAALADPLLLIDTHAHFQTIPFKDLEASHRTALKQMDQMNIGKSLLMPQPFVTKWFYDIEDLLFTGQSQS